MPSIHRLKNGVTVICETRKEPGNVAIQINIRNGAGHDDVSMHGLTSLMVNSCHGGTATRTREQITDAFTAVGASFKSEVTAEDTYFISQCRGRDCESVFETLGDIIRNPAFDAGEVARTQWMTTQNIDMRQQDTDEMLRDLFRETLYGSQPSGRSVLGGKALVESFTPSQVRRRHAELLACPDRIIVSLAGDIDEADALRLAQAHFGDLRPGPAPADVPTRFIGGDARLATAHEQLNLKIALPAPGKTDPQRYNLMMFSQLFGGGMSAPLFQEIRGKRGLVYGVGCGFNPEKDDGSFIIGAGSDGDSRMLVTASLELIADIAKKGFTQDQLDTARKSIMNETRAQLEKASTLAARNRAHYLQVGYVASIEALDNALRQVTSEGIQNAVTAMLAQGRYALAAIGPVAGLPSEQEIKTLILEQAEKMPATRPHAPSPSLSLPQPAFNAAASSITSIREPQATVLPNGITVVTVERPGSLTCGAWGNTGSDYETPAQNGAAHAIEHMMFRDTESYRQGDIKRIVEQELNGSLNAYTSTDRVAYYFYDLQPEALEKTVDICGEMLWKALIRESDWSGTPVQNPDGSTDVEGSERSAILQEILMYDDQVDSVQDDLLSLVSYPGQPSGRPILGTAGTLNDIKAADLIAFRDRYYAPGNIKFVAAGPILHQDFVGLIARKFGHLAPGVIHTLPTPVYHGGLAVKEMNTATMCEIAVAAEGVNLTHKDAGAYTMMAAMLGGGAASRLYREIALRRQLSNGVGAGMIIKRNGGRFVMGASGTPENAKKITALLFGELRRLSTDATQGELDRIKAQMETSLMNALETSQGSCMATATHTLVHGRPYTIAEQLAEIRAVTLADIKRVAAQVLQSSPAAALVVPPGTDRALLPTHAEMIALRDGKGQAPQAAPAPTRP